MLIRTSRMRAAECGVGPEAGPERAVREVEPELPHAGPDTSIRTAQGWVVACTL